MSVTPIVGSAQDLPAAIKFANGHRSSRWYVARRAAALGAANMIPKSWGLTAPQPRDARIASAADPEGRVRDRRRMPRQPGPVAADASFMPEQLKNYWARGEGAAQIGWGTDGDFDRCRTALRGKVPGHMIDGACANLHNIATGSYPGPGKGHGGSTASGASSGREGPRKRRALTAAGWDTGLHPRDRKGRFIDKLDLINVFSVSGGTEPVARGRAVGNRQNSDGSLDVEVELDNESKTHTFVAVDRIESAAPAKAKLTPDGVEAPSTAVEPEYEEMKLDSHAGVQEGDVIFSAMTGKPRWKVKKLYGEKSDGTRNFDAEDLNTGKTSGMSFQAHAPVKVGRPKGGAEGGDEDLPEGIAPAAFQYEDAPDDYELAVSEHINNEAPDLYDILDAQELNERSTEGFDSKRDPVEVANEIIADHPADEGGPDDTVELGNEDDFADKVSAMLSEAGIESPDEDRIREMFGDLTVDDAVDQYLEESNPPEDENVGALPDFGTVEDQNYDPSEGVGDVLNYDNVLSEEDNGTTLSPEAMDEVRWLDDFLNVDSSAGSWASGMSNHQIGQLGDYRNDWDEDPESVPSWASAALNEITSVSEETGFDVNDLIDARKRAAELGWSAEEQMRGVFAGEPLEEFNPNALRMVGEFLNSLPPAGDSDPGTVGSRLLEWLNTNKPPSGAPETNAPEAPSVGEEPVPDATKDFKTRMSERYEAMSDEDLAIEYQLQREDFQSFLEGGVSQEQLNRTESRVDKLEDELDKRGLDRKAARGGTATKKTGAEPAPETAPEGEATAPAAPTGGDSQGAKTVWLMAKSANKPSSKISEADAQAELDEILGSEGGDDAHKRLAALMTKMALGGKQRKRYREALDAHFGASDDTSAETEAAAVADNLSPNNPVKEKLAAKAAQGAEPGAPGLLNKPPPGVGPNKTPGFYQGKINLGDPYWQTPRDDLSSSERQSQIDALTAERERMLGTSMKQGGSVSNNQQTMKAIENRLAELGAPASAGPAGTASPVAKQAQKERVDALVGQNDAFPVNQLPAKERNAYIKLDADQRKRYRVARNGGASHSEALKAAKGPGAGAPGGETPKNVQQKDYSAMPTGTRIRRGNDVLVKKDDGRWAREGDESSDIPSGTIAMWNKPGDRYEVESAIPTTPAAPTAPATPKRGDQVRDPAQVEDEINRVNNEELFDAGYDLSHLLQLRGIGIGDIEAAETTAKGSDYPATVTAKVPSGTEISVTTDAARKVLGFPARTPSALSPRDAEIRKLELRIRVAENNYLGKVLDQDEAIKRSREIRDLQKQLQALKAQGKA